MKESMPPDVAAAMEMMQDRAPDAPLIVTEADVLELADSPQQSDRLIAEAMRTGNRALVAQVRAEVGR